MSGPRKHETHEITRAIMLKTYILLCLFICLLGFSQTSFAQQKPLNFSELEVTINEELRATNTPGASVAVVVGDRVVFAKGFGVADIETGLSVNPDTLFRIA